MKILIVEDNNTKRSMMRHVLLEKGHAVTEAENGAKGLESAAADKPDLIISDILMPEMDGFMFLRAVKKDERLKQIPFIFYSFVFTGHLEQKLAYILGAEAFIVPASINDFYRELSGIIDGMQLQEEVTLRDLYPDEEEFLRKYSAVVAVKLEEKVHELEKTTKSLRETRERLSHLMSQSPAVIYSCETEPPYAVTFISENIINLTGHSVNEFMEDPDFRADRIHPENKDAVFAGLAIIASGAKTDYRHEYRFLHRDGKYRFIYDELRFIRDEFGRPVEIIGFFLDITSRKEAEEALKVSEEKFRMLNAELERRVIERTAQLEMTNQELEAFSYSVSHDLKAPLNAIDGFTRILLDTHAGQLDSKALDHLGRVRDAAGRMSQLIDDLLRLSHVMRAELKKSRVDLTCLAREVAAELQGTEPGRQVSFVIAPSLSIDADLNLMRIVIDNLMRNAWKFTGKHPTALIEVGAEERDGERVFFVRDNGAGFDMSYAGKLFGAFQRLHRISEFEGTGIGLAIVKRIISRHGGRIWAEGKTGEGAVFWFTL
jgi:PAS domain S-box-containing protein